MPAFADLVCYWFERSRFKIEAKSLRRAGLLATNSIRGGANRVVLERIKDSGQVFMAWSDRPWVLDGAAVRVSMVGFDGGSEQTKHLNGSIVKAINADLSSLVDITFAEQLDENSGIQFEGTKKGADFDISPDLARSMLIAPLNPHGKHNSDVVRPWVNGSDVVKRPRGMWIIDFGTDMPLEQAALYEIPFQYVEKHVKPKYQATRRQWWLHERSRPEMRSALKGLQRFVLTPRVSKYRIFVWETGDTLPDSATIAFAREDDYFLGVLHSKLHELWSLRQGTSLEDRPRYTPTTTFETFPFPWPPGTEPTDDPRVQAIAQAAKELVEKRDNWLNPPGLSESELKKKTLTNLYNAMPTWLKMAHEKLDKAVFDAYGWPHSLSDEEILARLLALNLERAAGERLL